MIHFGPLPPRDPTIKFTVGFTVRFPSVMKKSEIAARLRHTTSYLSQRCDELESQAEEFQALTRSLIEKIPANRFRSTLPRNVLEYLTHWFEWWLILKDHHLELHNGELRHSIGRDLPYKNNFDFRQQERYYKVPRSFFIYESIFFFQLVK